MLNATHLLTVLSVVALVVLWEMLMKVAVPLVVVWTLIVLMTVPACPAVVQIHVHMATQHLVDKVHSASQLSTVLFAVALRRYLLATHMLLVGPRSVLNAVVIQTAHPDLLALRAIAAIPVLNCNRVPSLLPAKYLALYQ